jgi:DNA-binding NtrC family response regulator
LSGTRILVVDDDQKETQKFLDALLFDGFEGDAFNNYDAALTTVKQNPQKYGIVFIDMRIPGMSGLEVAKEIKRLNPTSLIYLMTSYENDLYKHDGSKLDTIDTFYYVKKPKDTKEMVNLISTALGINE